MTLTPEDVELLRDLKIKVEDEPKREFHPAVDQSATIAALNGQLLEVAERNERQSKSIESLILWVLIEGGLLALIVTCSILWGR